ncbi:hypothetical protein AEAC466_16115 [Asticcacaulis sp. AC466]|uniref:endonuclease/exonuclease/phosphatase family protein n=1 Tax=Asticcacaulis sp. AC466 TaxID=1282362 RepID=UPI0003C3BD28|nr:endonuclease/exonuclease/phosphatase family protein [Asticcacaulis sp. AC466]ESQ82665.1 hypothetical protein AEAC466_16115 [Asticcacaulis sp. AC466]
MRLLKLLFGALCLAAALAAMGVAIICLMNPHRPQLYLIDIFSVPITSGVCLLAVALWLVRQKGAAGLATLAAALLIASIWPQGHPVQGVSDPSRPAVRMMFANLLIRNTTPEKLLPWVEKQNPDVVAVVEANQHYRDQLVEGLKANRPYIATRYDMVVASRYPLSDQQNYPTGFALMTVKVKTPDGPLTLAVAHLTRPWPYTGAQDQPRQFDRLAHTITPMTTERFVVVGDFNSSPCAVRLQDLAKRTGLHIAPAFRGTWPTFLPGIFRITIDNGLASHDLTFSRRHAGPFDGSDHRPIVFDIRPVRNAMP